VSDNLFDRLFELFQSPGPVNWKLAAEVMRSLTGASEPIEPVIAEEYQELTLAAQLRLAEATDLEVSTSRPLHPVDRAMWAEENQQSFRYLIEPLVGKITGLGGEAQTTEAVLQPMGPAILGIQAGTTVGFMSHRALGQFDTGLPALDHDEMLLVVPNVEAFAQDHQVDARQIRLWAACQEVTHHAIMAVPWLRGHLVEMVRHFFESVQFDPSRLTEMLTGSQDPSELEGMVGDAGGLAGLLGSSHDPVRLAPIQALIALIDGYADYTVRRAAADLLPQLDLIEEANARRRVEPNDAEQFLRQLVGLELQRHRARDAASFCVDIEHRWSDDALGRLWEEPARLPTLEELTDPVGWAARTLLD
jgi:putative hydrolase